MAIGTNRIFNNPEFSAIYNNLASIFAPPSGSDLAGYATANATRQKSQGLAELLRMAQSGQFDQNVFDRLGQALGQWTPSTGYYNVNTTAETARRGQDIGAATTLQTNRLDNQTKAITDLYGPLSEGQIAPAVPPDIMGTLGLPGIDQRTGLPKPLSEDQVKAAVFQDMSPEEQRAMVFGNTPIEPVVTPEGPRNVTRIDAIGAEPFVKPGSEGKPTNAVALMPDGKTRVPARQDPDGRWVHAQTGQQLPEGIQIFSLPQATGSAEDVGLAPTTANTSLANNQEAEVTRALNLLDVYEAAVRSNPGSIGLAGLIRGTAQNAAQTAADLAAALGKEAPQVVEAASEIRDGLKGVAPEFFDRSIPEIDFLQGTLAYSLARTENPSGEVSRQAFDRAYERVKGGGLLANQQSALAAIEANRKVLKTQLEGIRTLRAPGTGRTDTSFQGDAPDPGVERWERGPDGKLRRVQQ